MSYDLRNQAVRLSKKAGLGLAASLAVFMASTHAKANPQADADQAAALLEFHQQQTPPMPMRITQAEWTPEMENRYSAFVAQIGRGIKAAPFRTIKNYMRNPAINPYASSDPAELILYSDCADLPYFLRAYFAAKNGLPMSFAAPPGMNMRPYASLPTRDEDLADAKTEDSPYGNFLVGRGSSNVPSAPGREKDYRRFWEIGMDTVSTRTFRVGPLTPNYGYSDVYPVKIDRQNVRPGTIVHTNGHIYVVVEVDQRGRIHMIDAHPDNSVSFKQLDSSKLARSRPDHGFGFFNFRPMRAVGGQWVDGALYGATVQVAGDQELFRQGKFSLEQWYGPGSQIAPASAVAPTQYLNAFENTDAYFEFIRSRVKQPGYTYPADQEIADQMLALCDEFKQRVTDVDKALTGPNPMNRRQHPYELPSNVFSTTGDWESYSTPSRDGRLREAVMNLGKSAVQKFKHAKASAADFTFAGTAQDFQSSIRSRMAIMDTTCRVSYTRSNGQQASIAFSDLIRRMPNMSFDPYHCAERRWGATGAEASSCVDTDANGQWYQAQQSMRNTIGKQDMYEKLVIRSNVPITFEMLRSGRYVDQNYRSPINLGAARSPLTDVSSYFSSRQFLSDLTAR